METNYKRTIAGSVGAGMGAIFNASGRKFFILEHKTESLYHHAGESQKIIVDQIELGRDANCQVRFDESCETVSRRHAAIVRDGEGWKLIPLSQTNATLVNGQPINGEWHLNSGDEIRLSSRGPVLGFIIPQGKQSMVSSIALTERMNLFRQQALRPYKTALILLTVFFILAVAALVGWNYYQAQQYEKSLAEAQTQINVIQNQVDSKTDEIVSLQQELADKNALSEEQHKAVVAKINQLNRERAELKQQQEEMQAKMEQMAKEAAAAVEEDSAEQTVGATSENAAAQQPADVVVEDDYFANIENCYDAVYYIRPDELAVYHGESNKEVVRFNLNGKVFGGTGFMLEDGRFVTANRTIEPWYHYINTELGVDSYGRKWTFATIHCAAVNGFKVVAEYTAYSASGESFSFRNTDMTSKVWQPSDYKMYSVTEKTIDVTTDSGLITLGVAKQATIYVRDKTPRFDWAVMAKRGQLHNVKGLKFNNEVSLNPKATTEVVILGYPLKEGFAGSLDIKPNKRTNIINVSGLNDRDIIELSSSRYQPGNDGAPVLQIVDGQWTVVGILCYTDSADRDSVCPIGNTETRK